VPLPVGTVAAAEAAPVGLVQLDDDRMGSALAQVHRDDHVGFGHRENVGKVVVF
jgi:hypothetical protein